MFPTNIIIVKYSGYLNNLLPGDVVLADRGFDVADSVAMLGATLTFQLLLEGVNSWLHLMLKQDENWPTSGYVWRGL